MQPQNNTLIYLTPAREDILDIARYHLEKVGISSARMITEEIEKCIKRLIVFPLMGQTHPDPILANSGFRKLVIKSTYVCVYKVLEHNIYIYRIVNGVTDYPRLLK